VHEDLHTPTYMWRKHAKSKAHIYVMLVNFWEIIIAFPNGGQRAPFSKVCPPWLKPLVTPLTETKDYKQNTVKITYQYGQPV